MHDDIPVYKYDQEEVLISTHKRIEIGVLALSVKSIAIF